MKTSTHGGKRAGAGRKKSEITETTGFRINQNALNTCRAFYGRSLNRKINDYLKRLAKNILKKDEKSFAESK